jgi:carboxyl-terminal processing protease
MVLLIALLTVRTVGHAATPHPESPLDQALVTDVATAALGFMVPRTLEPIPPSTMTLWGLRGLSTLDTRLNVDLTVEGKNAPLLVLTMAPGDHVLLSSPTPDEADIAGWGALIGQTVNAAWLVSGAVRQAGTEGVIHAFFDEFFNHLDPYSRYIPPQDADAERLRRAGRAGVGLDVATGGGGFVVSGVQAGGPAAQGGIRPGERILAVDGQSTQGADLADVNTLLAGPENTMASIALRGHDGKVREVDIERARVPPETVTAERNGDMLVLTISSFSRNTGARLAQELIRGMADPKPYHGVVLDLRGNRGGVLQQAVAAAAILQSSGEVAVTRGRDPQAAHVFLADGHDLANFLPVVVLVDGNSASAAEILAASLSDQRRAVVVGSATLGKGLVQTITPLPDGGELFLTWSRVLAPLGWPLQGLGVLPQVCTSLGPEVLAREMRDLANGIQPMAAALLQHREARAPLSPARILDIRGACPAAIGRATDLTVARFLIETPQAYRTALLTRPSTRTAAPGVAQSLTPAPPVSD